MRDIFFFLFLFFFNSSFSQYPILKDSTLKAGIYKDYKELRENSPSVQLLGGIKTETIKYNTNGSLEYLNTYYIDVEGKKAREIGDVFGFSDGKNVFITSDYATKINKNEFYKLDFINRYSYFYATESSQVLDIQMNVRVEKTLNLETGEILKLTNSSLKNIISDDKELLEKFKKQKKKYLHYKEYLLNYLKENK
ncbi:hypothetical protein [uncultured Flavobacterium sp.]|uniref:hypothetical protein n=1 Tax=uncultured Flavobacterium sp. TaxID=165435 RepID=UPI0030EDEC37|tara:strand:+ start:195694 stop:196278 length:585 start_codon:yes stop_codon:yes gene_type:complete